MNIRELFKIKRLLDKESQYKNSIFARFCAILRQNRAFLWHVMRNCRFIIKE